MRLKPLAARVEEKGIQGDVIGLDDPFGSLITDIARGDFDKLGYALGEKVKVQIGKKSYAMPYVKTFADVPADRPGAVLVEREGGRERGPAAHAVVEDQQKPAVAELEEFDRGIGVREG